jgi:hypothetical protein
MRDALKFILSIARNGGSSIHSAADEKACTSVAAA